MQIFFSWQSNLPKSSKFVRKCLDKAIKKLKGEIPAENFTLEHDTKGVRGSPDIVQTILKKIDASDVFVGDLTIVQNADDSSAPAQCQGSTSPHEYKRDCYPNPNVLFELGYATAKLGLDNVYIVMDAAHGKPENLPFDIKLKRMIPFDKDKPPEELANKLCEHLRRFLKSRPMPTALDVLKDWICWKTWLADQGAVPVGAGPDPRLPFVLVHAIQSSYYFGQLNDLATLNSALVERWQDEKDDSIDFATRLVDAVLHYYQIRAPKDYRTLDANHFCRSKELLSGEVATASSSSDTIKLFDCINVVRKNFLGLACLDIAEIQRLGKMELPQQAKALIEEACKEFLDAEILLNQIDDADFKNVWLSYVSSNAALSHYRLKQQEAACSKIKTALKSRREVHNVMYTQRLAPEVLDQMFAEIKLAEIDQLLYLQHSNDRPAGIDTRSAFLSVADQIIQFEKRQEKLIGLWKGAFAKVRDCAGEFGASDDLEDLRERHSGRDNASTQEQMPDTVVTITSPEKP